MGTGVVFGMTIATAVGLFIIPVCYVFVQRIVESGRKKVPAATPARPGFPHAAIRPAYPPNPPSDFCLLTIPASPVQSRRRLQGVLRQHIRAARDMAEQALAPPKPKPRKRPPRKAPAKRKA